MPAVPVAALLVALASPTPRPAAILDRPDTVPVTATVCDVLARPESFDNRLVRLRAKVVLGFELTGLADPTGACGGFLWFTYLEEDSDVAGTGRQVVRLRRDATLARLSRLAERTHRAGLSSRSALGATPWASTLSRPPLPARPFQRRTFPMFRPALAQRRSQSLRARNCASRFGCCPRCPRGSSRCAWSMTPVDRRSMPSSRCATLRPAGAGPRTSRALLRRTAGKRSCLDSSDSVTWSERATTRATRCFVGRAHPSC
jgi:hypothetical protein